MNRSYGIVPRIVVAIDSFKGCITSAEANGAACLVVNRLWPEAAVAALPVSDGGEGWLEAFRAAIGGVLRDVEVFDPLLRPIRASFLQNKELAVIETAQASGLTLLRPEERHPLQASSYGTGQLVIHALNNGCRRLVVGLGGSAVSDAGRGLLKAIDEAWPEGLKSDLLRQVQITIATDVTNPLCGENGAAAVFGPQKGATPEEVAELDRRAAAFARSMALLSGYDCSHRPGAGAAGGLGYAFMQCLHAECRPGIDLLMDMAGFDHLLSGAGLVITGEGSADGQTLMGKLPMGIMKRALRQGVPTLLIAGRVAEAERLLQAGFSRVECIHPWGFPHREAMRPEVTLRHIGETLQRILSELMPS